MLLLLVLTLLAVAVMGGAWYGRLQERAWWTQRLLERGIHPNTLHAQRGTDPLEPLAPDADAMRDAMDQMAREVERLAQGQRFITQVLTERKALPGGAAGPAEEPPPALPRDTDPR
jgi:hypothetical protein